MPRLSSPLELKDLYPRSHADLSLIGTKTHVEIDTAITRQFVLLVTSATTGTGASADSSVHVGIIPYASWRVLAVGFRVSGNSTSTIAEKVNIGLNLCDIGGIDDDYFGSCVQDITTGKQLVNGDMIMNPLNVDDLVNPDASANGGTHAWTAGNPNGIGVWQTKQGVLVATKKLVTGSTGTIVPWVYIEVAI